MNNKTYKTLLFIALITVLASCSNSSNESIKSVRYQFDNILDIAYTPDTATSATGWFVDAGSWVSYTIPETEKWVNGFCGPFSLDMNRRQWLAKSALKVSFEGYNDDLFVPDSTNYFPGEIFISARSPHGKISQSLNFIDASNAVLTVETDEKKALLFTGEQWGDDIDVTINKNFVTARHPSGERVLLTFGPDIKIKNMVNNYEAISNSNKNITRVVISFFTSEKDLAAGLQKSLAILNNSDKKLLANEERWNGYLSKVLRNDMQPAYNRIATKAVVTLISNWRTHRGGLLHEGVVPSHAVGYFVGFWAWDSWKHSVALAKFHPELAKNGIRAMFDYQQNDGMIIDCIYSDTSENNARDSKPPLVAWAVNEIFTQTKDTAFVKEMYPQMMSYYNWWFNKRDHDKNGLCEFGSTDGTLLAAAWESGMDNAIRFDGAKMLQNKPYNDAWSMNQENVDLNSYLALEATLLKKFSKLIGAAFNAPDHSAKVADYFFDKENGFFFDRQINGGVFITEPGCEAYAPLWANVATAEQVAQMLPQLQDTSKFSTYIPFPTIAADNPKYDSGGYWRGPIWLDQTYFAIKGLRNYGYNDLADKYTLQVFNRLEGLTEKAPIHENYGTHTGKRLKAPHFSWSAAHLLMLYDEYGKTKH